MSFVTLGISLYPQSTHAGALDFFMSILGSSDAKASNIANTSSSSSNSQTMQLLQAPVNANPTPTSTVRTLSIVNNSALETSQGPGGTAREIEERKGSDIISVYTVHEGDTLSEIAYMFDVSPNTILWANDLKSAKDIHPGDQLIILPISGLKYTVKKGDTLAKIAKETGGNAEDIISYNNLADDYVAKAGDTLIIPDGEMHNHSAATPTKPSTGSSNTSSGGKYAGYFIRPAAGTKTQGLHGKYRTGVDIASAHGTTIKAAASGRVLIAKSSGYNGGYGVYVVIQHDNGLQTLYGHLSSISVSAGSYVSQGEVIGKMGSTGNSTGTHLHFEIWGGVRNWNPF